MANIIPQSGRLIGTIVPDVTIEESTVDAWEITQHPVQQGASISDHKYRKPVSLKMIIAFGGQNLDLAGTYQSLLNLQASTDLFTIQTPKRNYKNMQMKSLSCTTDNKTENILSITGDFVEVIIASVVVTNVPARSKQKNPAKTGATENAGAKTPKPLTKEEEESVGNKIATSKAATYIKNMFGGGK